MIIAGFGVDPSTNKTVFTGAVCERNAGLYSRSSSDPAMRTCQRLGGGGAPCSSETLLSCASVQCKPDLTCAAVVPAGQACGSDPGTVCDVASTCVFSSGSMGTCTAKLPGGSACTDDEMCASNGCGSDGRCATLPFWDAAGFCALSI